jgi:hypothetical protein
MGHAVIDQSKISRLEAENKRLRTALLQISVDCFKVMDDEICSEAERRSWRAIGRFAAACANQ